ncbi:hypothetical protein KY360_00515 [Candidatus Woesearchaeota archaeon]|nr:hypothetical protein [Candidatus Woesearchaeota archaeon]
MRNKKGVLIAWEKLIALIPQIIAFFILLGVIAVACSLFVIRSPSLASRDLQRIAAEINKISQENEDIEVPVFGSNYNIAMWAKTEGPDACGKEACICTYKKNGVRIECIKFGYIVKQGDPGHYFENSGVEIGQSTERELRGDKTVVRIVNRENSIIISDK